MRGQWAWTGLVTVTVRDLLGRPVERVTLRNTITDAGRDLVRDLLRGAEVRPQIRWMALGADGTAPAGGDTALGDERHRVQITSYATPGTGQVTSTFYVPPGQANDFTVEELGWYAGDATAAADSGLLVARVLYSRAKVASESLQIDRTDAFAEET